MAIDVEFRTVSEKLQKLRDAFQPLRLNAKHDGPPAETNKLVEDYGEAADQVLEQIDAAIAAVAEARLACDRSPGDINRSRQALYGSALKSSEARRLFLERLSGAQTLLDLAALGRKNKGRHAKWAACVIEATDECRRLWHDLDASVLSCCRQFSQHAVELMHSALYERPEQPLPAGTGDS